MRHPRHPAGFFPLVAALLVALTPAPAALARRHSVPAATAVLVSDAPRPYADRCVPDAEGPILACPTGLITVATPSCLLQPEPPIVFDYCDPAPTVRAIPERIEGVGEHAVNFVASDRSGNASACVMRFLLDCDRCSPPSEMLVAWWPMDVSSADSRTVFDRGGGNHGEAMSGPTLVRGRVGSALHFDGHHDFVRAVNTRLHNYLSLTIEAWIKPDRVDGSMEIVAFQNSIYGLAVESGELRFHLAALPLWFSFTSEGAHLAPGRWSHVAVTADRSTGEVRFFVDGERLTVSPPVYSPLMIFPGTEWLIGSGPGGAFAGAIDEVRIYERALSDEEIRAIVESGGAGVCADPAADEPPPLPLPLEETRPPSQALSDASRVAIEIAA